MKHTVLFSFIKIHTHSEVFDCIYNLYASEFYRIDDYFFLGYRRLTAFELTEYV